MMIILGIVVDMDPAKITFTYKKLDPPFSLQEMKDIFPKGQDHRRTLEKKKHSVYSIQVNDMTTPERVHFVKLIEKFKE